jgi:hypothetical protein
MSSDDLKDKANRLAIENGSKHELICAVIVKGFLDSPKDTQALLKEIKHTIGKKLKSNEIQTYMKKFMEAGIVQAIHHSGHRGNYWVLASVRKDVALSQISKGENVLKVEENLFSDQLLTRVGRDFEIEFEDLRHNFGKSGTCTSFMLRKILEKLIFVSFAKHGLEHMLNDSSRPGLYVGLENMIHLASSEKVNGKPFLTGRTAKEIRGIKFLGDVAAHNPLTNVDMKTIILQMPFIITAFEELSIKL